MSIPFKNTKMEETAFLIQILVRNYLENEFEMKGSFYLYEEIINDINVFTQNLKKISSSRPAIEPPHIIGSKLFFLKQNVTWNSFNCVINTEMI